jgi:hypothetical protein
MARVAAQRDATCEEDHTAWSSSPRRHTPAARPLDDLARRRFAGVSYAGLVGGADDEHARAGERLTGLDEQLVRATDDVARTGGELA